ncbi:dihydropteroate synthase [Lysinibacillus sp. BF-4]|uniref:dihydropteroate synthase n=1 Tax=Lysinibacillus sp. BF-4 TaxID=1473546 RepID=UPI0004FFDA82|nr:dihydropteroate synthase [Lysinibacillus sp. BF-4]KFL42958.1 dihydropteroate synthase [Lysinibacillus sp. BF-4]
MLEHYRKPLTINGITLDYTKETFIMGILNVTPDSFSDGGNYTSVAKAVAQAKKMVAEGAKIIDVGGESTRPGHVEISEEEEIARVVPVIEALVREVHAVISIDTYKANVAEAAIKAGAHMINDVWGAKADARMASVAAQYNVPIILMHNRDNTDYKYFWLEVHKDLQQSLAIARAAGVPDAHIILDPGIGFGKTTAQNIKMMQHLPDLVAMGYPVLLATSRKSMIGNVLDLPTAERLEGTMATVVYGIDRGCHMMRLHDIEPMRRAMKMTDVLVGKQTIEEA